MIESLKPKITNTISSKLIIIYLFYFRSETHLKKENKSSKWIFLINDSLICQDCDLEVQLCSEVKWFQAIVGHSKIAQFKYKISMSN